jgi:predicted TIM-barrel fold metal-dependent hydrolase
MFLNEAQIAKLKAADEAAFRSPVPTQVVSNGEYMPIPQTSKQRQVEELIKAFADKQARRLGLDRRAFLRTAAGMATAFIAMNQVFGDVFKVSAAEAAEPDAASERAQMLAKQFIFDVQTHFIRDDFNQEGMLALAKYAEQNWNPAMTKDTPMTLERYKFNNYVKEIFLDSDTKVSLLSGAPFDDKSWWFLSNDQIAEARRSVNALSGSTRMLSHAVFTPKQPGWMEEVDRAMAVNKPNSWKGYTIGDPLKPQTTQFPWRLDDEKLIYPFYEKIVKAGSPIVCIHKGLLPPDYEKSVGDAWKFATVDDVGKAAKDWPQINFVIYHSALRQFLESPDNDLATFEKTGKMLWTSDLAEIPQKFGVTNVYSDLGTSFANSAVSNPRFAAAFMGTLVKGLGADHILWGSDSVFYGSPQWQIEAMRRLEIPEDMQKKQGFAPLGAADGPVKSAIFGLNAARFYKVNLRAAYHEDGMGKMRAAYLSDPPQRSNATYGYIARG